MPVNYSDPMGSIESEKKRKMAQEGEIPEGQYLAKLMKVKYHPGTNEAKTLWRWELGIRFVMSDVKNVFHRAERTINFFDTDARWAAGDMEKFFLVLEKMGLNVARNGDISSPNDILDWVDRAIEANVQFKIDVEDKQMSWNKETRTEELNLKYPNKFSINLDTVPDVFTKIKNSMKTEQAGEAEDEIPADETEEEESAPVVEPAPKATAPAQPTAQRRKNPYA